VTKFKALIGKPELKKTLGRPRCRWVYLKICLKEMGQTVGNQN